MPTLTELIDKKLDNLHRYPDQLESAVDSQQKKLLREINTLLKDLELDGGNIIVSEANIAKINAIIEGMKDVFFDASYIDALKEFASGFEAQAIITRELIELGIGDIPANALFQQVLNASRLNAIELFSESVLDTVYFEPLRQQLFTSITTGASFSETMKAVQLITVGDETADGLLHTYAKTYSRTSFAQADATYTTTISREMGVEWYKYAGSVIESSREFCDTRHNKYYHVAEVESWGELGNWAGKIKGTNSSTIFANRGGWNCRHSLVPYSAIRVPKAQLQRAINKGFFNPTEAEKAELGLAA